MAKLLFAGFIVILSYLPQITNAQKDSLRFKIEQISKLSQGSVGVAILNIETGDTLSFQGEKQFPMQSVFKFPIAMAVLNKVDSGKLSLSQKVHIGTYSLPANIWSPIRVKYPKGNIDLTISELLSYTVSQSDNNGCDILLDLLGGTKSVEDYIHSLGVMHIAIAATEKQMHKGWNVQYKNWCEPLAMTKLLDIFFKGKILSKSSTDFLWKIMEETTTGKNRIKGLLPIGTQVAHKTGTGGVNDKGMNSATNDVGIITLPNGNHLAIVVYVANSYAIEKTRDAVIAKIAKAVWDNACSK
jgi:beta-lactamase class A